MFHSNKTQRCLNHTKWISHITSTVLREMAWDLTTSYWISSYKGEKMPRSHKMMDVYIWQYHVGWHEQETFHPLIIDLACMYTMTMMDVHIINIDIDSNFISQICGREGPKGWVGGGFCEYEGWPYAQWLPHNA